MVMQDPSGAYTFFVVYCLWNISGAYATTVVLSDFGFFDASATYVFSLLKYFVSFQTIRSKCDSIIVLRQCKHYQSSISLWINHLARTGTLLPAIVLYCIQLWRTVLKHTVVLELGCCTVV